MRLFCVVFVITLCGCAWADVSHIVHGYTTTTPPPGPPNPYIFSYQAGRAPGHVDRTHTEVSDGSGVVRGAFSYVDPKNQVRTVQYVADEHGFHPQLSHQNEDSEAVKLEKQKHFSLYNRIAQQHQQAAAAGGHYALPAAAVAGPHQSEAVLRATNKHLSEYERIAAQHAALGAQLEAERKAYEATSEHSLVEDGQYHHQRY